ncbi:MAG: response regulator [Phycisphaerales bacterium]|nr:response regulator [Phycisphaerales bacterium]
MSPIQNTSSANGPCIVLVDDEPHITHMVARKLSQCGYSVHRAMDGKQGLELIQEVHPDLVVTDLQMPYMSGIELSTRLFSSEKTRDIPVIMLSARGFAIEDQIKELDNVRSLLSKPFGIRSLIELIGKTLDEAGGGLEQCA